MGKINKIDIREHGSGNAGTTNTMRVLGKQAGIIVYLGDCIKCIVAIIIAMFVFKSEPHDPKLIKLIAGFGVVLGHNYPIWLKFKGGKGIAVTSAVILAVCIPDDYRMPLMTLCLFVIIVMITKYVSLGSLMVVLIFFAYVAFALKSEFPDDTRPMIIFAGLFAASAFISHRKNIKRLFNGTENKIGKKYNPYYDVNMNQRNNFPQNNMNNPYAQNNPYGQGMPNDKKGKKLKDDKITSLKEDRDDNIAKLKDDKIVNLEKDNNTNEK